MEDLPDAVIHEVLEVVVNHTARGVPQGGSHKGGPTRGIPQGGSHKGGGTQWEMIHEVLEVVGATVRMHDA